MVDGRFGMNLIAEPRSSKLACSGTSIFLAWARDLPRVGLAQPVVRLLHLISVSHRLTEDPVSHAGGRSPSPRCCSVASESMKQAARRPRPPLPRPASGSSSRRRVEIPALAVERALNEWGGGQVDDVVVQRAPEQELHRQVVDALGVGLLACQSRLHPAVRHQVADEPCNRLEPLTRTGAHGVHDVLAEQISVRPVGVVASYPQSFEPALEGRRCRALSSLRHDRRSCVPPSAAVVRRAERRQLLLHLMLLPRRDDTHSLLMDRKPIASKKFQRNPLLRPVPRLSSVLETVT